MFDALTCVPNNVDPDNYGDLFGLVCGLSEEACAGIATNASDANYGAYGMCNSEQQLGWALNAYYEQQNANGNGASACDFDGSATLTQGTAPTGDCLALISEAGANGQGTVTSGPTATGGSGGSGSGGSSSNAGVPGFPAHSSTFGIFQASLYLLVAFVSGMGMILL